MFVGEGGLDVAGRQASGIHLRGQLLEHLRIALEQFEQLRVKGLPGLADLGQIHPESSLRSVQMTRFIPVAVAVALTALVVRPTKSACSASMPPCTIRVEARRTSSLRACAPLSADPMS